MSWIAAGVAVGTVGAAAISANASNKAAGAQGRASDQALAADRSQLDITRTDMAPYRVAGKTGIGRLQEFLGLSSPNLPDDVVAMIGPKPTEEEEWARYNAAHKARFGTPVPQGVEQQGHVAEAVAKRTADWEARGQEIIRQRGGPTPGEATAASPLLRKFSEDDFWQDPVTKLSFQFGMDEGRKALDRSAPLTTGRDSGAALKELTKFGTDYAATRAGDSYNRFENDKTSIFNKLAAIAGIGQTASNTVAQAGMNSANNVSNILTAQGNAAGASRIAQGNAWGGALGNLSNWWQQQNTLNRMDGWFNRPQSTPTSNFAYNGYGRAGDYQYG